MSDQFDTLTEEALEGFMASWRSEIEALQNRASDIQAAIRERQDQLGEAAVALQRKIRQREHDENQARGQAWLESDPDGYWAFVESIRERCRQGILAGAEQGWWDLDEQGEMMSPAQVFRMSDFAEVRNPTLGHVMAAAGLFPSVGQARKNGFDEPLRVGEWTVTKKRIRIRVID